MVVRAVFAAFAERDVERVLELIDPEVEFRAMTGDYAGRTGPYRGHELRLTPREYRAVGSSVLVVGRVSARSHARIVEGSTGWVWRVRGGRVVYGRAYPSAAEAEQAAMDDGAL